MNFKMRETIYKMLPNKLKEMRTTYLKGKMGELAPDNEFLFDLNILPKLKVKSYSQFGQDAFIQHFVFGNQENGVFLDIGGNNPVKINNTFLLEQAGWSGLAFEPIKEQAKLWKDKRKTPCLNIAIGDSECEIEFTQMKAHEFSGVSDLLSEQAGERETYKVQQRKLSNVLAEYGIKHVDFVSLDVEGYEMNVLKGIDFKKTSITCFCIENNREGDDRADLNLRRFMMKRGYRLVARLTIDDIFIKEKYFLENNNAN